MVVPFVKKELSEHDTERFLAHVEACPDCMDELDIYFMVYHALNVMDSGERHEYDFKKMLAEEIRAARHAIWKRKAANIGRVVLLTVAEAMLFLCIFIGIRMKQGAVGDSIFERALLRMHIEQMNTAEEALSETETDTGEETEILQTMQAEETGAVSETADTTMAEEETMAVSAAGEIDADISVKSEADAADTTKETTE